MKAWKNFSSPVILSWANMARKVMFLRWEKHTKHLLRHLSGTGLHLLHFASQLVILNADKFDKVAITLNPSPLHTQHQIVRSYQKKVQNNWLRMIRWIDCEAANEYTIRSSSSCFVEDFLFVQWFVLGLQMESFCLQLEWRPTTDWFQILTESNLKPSPTSFWAVF